MLWGEPPTATRERASMFVCSCVCFWDSSACAQRGYIWYWGEWGLTSYFYTCAAVVLDTGLSPPSRTAGNFKAPPSGLRVPTCSHEDRLTTRTLDILSKERLKEELRGQHEPSKIRPFIICLYQSGLGRPLGPTEKAYRYNRLKRK